MNNFGFGKILRFALLVATLFGVWLLLSGRFYPHYLVLGATASLLIALEVFPWTSQRSFPVIRFLMFVPWQLWQVFLSNLRVARVVVSRRAEIEPQFIRVRPGVEGERALAVLGSAVTLTPGTLTVEIDAKTMLVHALDARSARDIREQVMSKRVAGVFERA
jgi:multicomponent Na+:H+ antiporter subunit E